MPRYYIDVRSHFGRKEDVDGVELPDVATAKTEALRLGENLLEGCAGLSPDYSSQIVIEIVDEELRPVLAIPYAEITKQSQPVS
ncbi:hypothetical protein JKG68_10645 [Microvirga aerilata]|uniref:DUF6894 domain-containing protein n=1 Tax=Microvirga aerilata TaxID=670292 RepID=A0A936ZC87_9HYPH|nr:hypothetical protein [Microvirga aerilata]MBL0404427.1 hypothetical protein [Microvirga aerilata]